MILPRNSLVFWTAAVVVPLAVLGGALPGMGLPALAGLAIFAVAVLFDAITAAPLLSTLRVECPAVVRLQNGRRGMLPMTLHHAAGPTRSVRIGLAFPREIDASETDRMVQLPAEVEESTLNWACTPSKRGQYFLHSVHFEVQSRLGLWAVRGQGKLSTELRVYPDLLSERKHAASLFLRRNTLGNRALRAAGQGREFEKLREFVPGDGIQDIHWKASAKRRRPVTKVYQIERSQEVYVVVDASRLSARKVQIHAPVETPGPGHRSSEHTLRETTALERYVTAALMVALAAERQGDQFGLLTFSNGILDFVRARSGPSHFDACRDRLYTLQPQDVTPDFEECCTFIRLRLRKRALLIFLTALDDPILAENFVKATDIISRQQLILANMLQPKGAAPLFSDGAPAENVDDIYQRLGGHLRWQNLRELQKTLQRRGVRLSFLDPEKLSAELIAQHADVRARQLL